jgi:hypothetical protein
VFPCARAIVEAMFMSFMPGVAEFEDVKLSALSEYLEES